MDTFHEITERLAHAWLETRAGGLDAAVTVDNGAKPHCADFSLTKNAAGRPVRKALSGLGLSG